AANLEPSINAVKASATVLDFIDLACFERLYPCLNHAGEIVRMNDVDKGPVLQLLVGFAEVLQRLAVEELGITPRRRRYHEPRHITDDLAPGQFLCPQALPSTLAILNIQVHAVPFDDSPRFVPQWAGAKQEPAIGAIETAQARLGLSRLFGSH